MDQRYYVDLDELILECYDVQAKQYISEAVACYRAGAFRSCIITTWLAVVFDFIYKLHELELTGDKRAAQLNKELEQIRKSNDKGKSLKFENEILGYAKGDFELISDVELTDLERLYEDRHRCAHPSLTIEGEIYNPSAELARTHLRNAVSYLLRHPPVQGKAALERLVKDVSSNYFPTEAGDAEKWFRKGPLNKARESLIRNFVIVLMKALFKDLTPFIVNARYVSALKAVCSIHRAKAGETIKSKINEFIQELTDDQLWATVLFLHCFPDVWEYINSPLRAKIERYVENLPIHHLDCILDEALHVGCLIEKAKIRISTMNTEELKVSLSYPFFEKKFLVNRALVLYGSAASFDGANDIAKEIMYPLIEVLTAENIETILKSASENSQVRGSFTLESILNLIFRSGKLTNDTLKNMVKRYGLEDNCSWLFRDST